MKLLKIVLVTACLFMAVTAHAQTNRGYTGSWFNPAQNGHGWNIEVLENGNLLVFWYTYREDGTSTFLLGVLSGGPQSYTGTLSITEGMTFGEFDPDDNDTVDWGELTLVFQDCNSMNVFWSTTMEGFSNGSTPANRLTSAAGQECNDSPFVGNYVFEVIGADGIESGRAIMLPTGVFGYFSINNDGSEVGYGTWEQNGSNTMSFEADAFEDTFTPAPLMGTATANDDGFVGLANLGTAAVGGTRTASYQNNISLGGIAGDYFITDTLNQESLGSVNITANGMMDGNFVDCTFVGQITVPSTGRNQFEVQIDYTCVGLGTFHGVGVTDGDNLSMILVDAVEESGYLMGFERQ